MASPASGPAHGLAPGLAPGLASGAGAWLGVVRADLAVALLAVLMFVAPLYRSGVFEDSFILPKTTLIQWIALAALGVSVPRALRGGDTSVRRRDWTGLLLALWVGVHGVSALWARSGALAFNQISYFIGFLVLYCACLWGLRSARAVRAVAAAGVAAATVTAVWVLAEDALRQQNPAGLVARLPDWRGYLAAGLGNSGHIAGFIGLFLPAAVIALLAAPRFRPGLLAAIGLMFAALVVTWSVGSTGSTVLALLVWGALAAFVPAFGLKHTLRWQRLVPVVAVGAAAAAFYLLPHPLNPHAPSLWTEAFGSERWKEGGVTRDVIYRTTWAMIRQDPVRGVGAGNFTLEYVRQVVPSVIADPRLRLYAGSFTNDAHNEYLQMWSEAGIFALAAWLGLIAVFFRRLVSLLRSPAPDPEARLLLAAAGVGVTVFLLDSLMTFPIRLPAHFAALMLWLAVPGVVGRTVPEAAAPRRGRGRKRERTRKRERAPKRERDKDQEAVQVGATLSAARSETRFAGRPPRRGALLAAAVVLGVLGLVSAVHQTRRLVAAFHLKQGRMAVETTPILLGGQPVPLWSAAEYHFHQGSRALAAGDEARARQSFNLASVLMQHEVVREAEASFHAALRWAPRYADARSRLGALLLMRGDATAAANEAAYTLRDLESSEIWERLGLALWLKGDPKGAAEAWEVPARRRPLEAEYFRALIQNAGSMPDKKEQAQSGAGFPACASHTTRALACAWPHLCMAADLLTDPPARLPAGETEGEWIEGTGSRDKGSRLPHDCLPGPCHPGEWHSRGRRFAGKVSGGAGGDFHDDGVWRAGWKACAATALRPLGGMG